ncbi:hypothetical protein Q1695_014911 [Nippostrongylus brasiliensis]|nr:hypothetical protein Q1695_014911 [Nippostrongylus brasiliensis]
MTSARDYMREKMPIVGFGTYQIRSEKILEDVVDAALSCGYRFFDTAQIYGNEAALGRIFQDLLPKYNLERSDIFITSKVSPANQGTAAARRSIKKSLENLQTDYIDLMLIHWPGCGKIKVKDPRNAELRRETYEALEEFHESGELRSIGVSNYEIRHLEQLLDHCKINPAVNQVEFHPHFHQRDLLNFCLAHDIHFQAYSSLGGPDYREELFNDPDVVQLAEKYQLTVAQLLLCWATSQSISVLPRNDIEKLWENGKCQKACWDPSEVV